jgi:chromosome segregation ATPase
MMIMAEENMEVKDIEHVSFLKERLHQVADEIDAIKNSFSKGTEDLSRIQSMLDIENLEEIGNIIENFEGRVSEVEKRREEAAKGAQRYGEELEKEKERLIKLWDAYKNQEEELSTAEKKLAEFEERMREADASKKQLEDDLTTRINTLNAKLTENEEKIQHFDELKQRCEEFDGIRNRLEEEIRSLRDEADTKDKTINSLQKHVDEVKEHEKYAEYKDKFNDVSMQYEKEKERLTKLFKLYEETEAERNNLREEIKSWQDWFNSNKDIFDRLFSTGPPVSAMKTPAETPPTPETPPEEKKSKKKRKLRFKK